MPIVTEYMAPHDGEKRSTFDFRVCTASHNLGVGGLIFATATSHPSSLVYASVQVQEDIIFLPFVVSDGFFITTGQNRAIFKLPSLNLIDHSGSLSFDYKFFNRGASTLSISVCDHVIRNVTPRSRGSWESIRGIRIYCNGQRPTVILNSLFICISYYGGCS